MACHGPKNSKVAELRSCNQGFHIVGVGSLLAIFVSHSLLSIFLSFSHGFPENSLQRGAYRWLRKKKRKKGETCSPRTLREYLERQKNYLYCC